MGNFIFEVPAGAFGYPAANPAPLDRDTGANGGILRQRFDDTTEEFVETIIPGLPSNVDANGTVQIIAVGYAVTAAASKEIQLRLGHSAVGDGESWDTAYTDEDSGDQNVNATQDRIDIFQWTETFANLGWAASDQIRLQLSRIAIDDGTKLTGDWALTSFMVIIPVV